MPRVGNVALYGATGGEAFFPYSMDQIEEAYDKIVAEIRAQYSLGYVSTNAARDGRWRKVEVKLRGSGFGELRVRTRKGYFAAYEKK